MIVYVYNYHIYFNGVSFCLDHTRIHKRKSSIVCSKYGTLQIAVRRPHFINSYCLFIILFALGNGGNESVSLNQRHKYTKYTSFLLLLIKFVVAGYSHGDNAVALIDRLR